MKPYEIRLLARIGAIEFLVENVYAVALMQCFDPAAEARRWSAQIAELARRAGSEGVEGMDLDQGIDRREAAALVTGMAHELDAIFGRITDRIDRRAQEHPTAGTA